MTERRLFELPECLPEPGQERRATITNRSAALPTVRRSPGMLAFVRDARD